MLRRLLVLLLAVGLVAGVAQAQDMDQVQKFIQELSTKLGAGDSEGAIRLVETNPELAVGTATVVAQMYDKLTPDQQQASLLLINFIARVLQVRKGDNRLTQELAQRGVLAPDSTWEGTSLAAGTAAVKTTPDANQASQEQLLFNMSVILLRLGNYSDLGNMLELLPQVNPTPAQTRVFERFRAAALLGAGLHSFALQKAEELLATPTDPQEQLATELVALMAARSGGFPAKARQHLKTAQALQSKVSGPYAEVAAYLIESAAFELDIEQNPDMSNQVIKQRHAQAAAHLNNLPATADLEFCTTELRWVADMVWEGWFNHLLYRGDRNQGDQLGNLLLEDITMMAKLTSAQREKGHIETILGLIALMENFTSLSLQADRLPDARTGLQQLQKYNASLKEFTTEMDKIFQEKVGPVFAQTGLNLRMANGEPSVHLATLHLLQGEALLKESKPPWPAATQQKFKAELEEAYRASMTGSSLEVISDILFTRIGFLFEAKPAGWAKEVQEGLDALQAVPGLADQRGPQILMAYYRGKLQMEQGNKAEAIANLQKAVDVAEQYIREVGGGQSSAEYLRSFVTTLYTDLAQAQLEKGQNPDAFNTIGRLQQMETNGVFKTEDLLPKLKTEDRPLVQRAKEQQETIESQEKELASLHQTKATAAQIQRADKLLSDSRESYYNTVHDLETKYPAFQKLDIKPINFSKLQRAIPPDTLVVLLFPTDDQLYLMEATNEKLLVRQVAIKRSELEALATDFRQQVTGFARNPTPFSWKGPESANLKRDLSQLYDTIVKPLEADMQGKAAVAFVPYGNLVYLPFQAFLTQNADGGVTFLVEKKEVVVLSKAADLDQIFGLPSAKNGSLVAFGNPDGSLPGATQEVQALGAIFPGSEIFLEGQATEEKLKTVQAPKVSYLHLATHGTLNAQDPRQSYLTLAKGGKVSVSDITGYRLDSAGGDLNLVTLSACQTALADRSGAGDGSDLRSLADAFSFAGCRSMVASLWKVDDNSTRDLMVEFYKNLKAGKSKAASLQAAQISLLKQDKYAHPFFWAPFILIGDWR